MGFFRKKPVVVEAVQWTGDNEAEITAFCPDAKFETFAGSASLGFRDVVVPFTPGRGGGRFFEGDWLVKSAESRIGTIPADTFAQEYEPVPDPVVGPLDRETAEPAL